MTSNFVPHQHDIEVRTGLWLRVTPVPPFVVGKIEQEAEKLFPPIDEKPFRKQADGMKFEYTDKNDAEYQRLLIERQQNIVNFKNAWMLHHGVKPLDENGLEIDKATIIEQALPVIEYYRGTGLDGIPEDNWDAALNLSVLATPVMRRKVLLALNDMLPISEAEIEDAGFRIIQHPLRRDTPTDSAKDESARSVQVEQSA